MKRAHLLIFAVVFIISSCKNHDINEGEEFRLRSINDSFENIEFDKVTVDGVDYLMMERDNNNPHEGFGFMAFRANTLLEKQDSIISFLKAMQYFQNKMYAQQFAISEQQAQEEFDSVFDQFLLLEQEELDALIREDLNSGTEDENEGEN
ncbi:MAG: hypothetical protein AAF616_07205 [Bacteroidota bacterium]